MLICKLLVILLMLSLLVLFTTVIINYFNKIEEFTTLYVSNFPQNKNGKSGADKVQSDLHVIKRDGRCRK